MNEIIKTLAVEAGFKLADDGNFVVDAWCNQEIAKLAKLVADDCIKVLAKIALENADNDDQVWIASKTINTISARFDVK